MQVIPHIVHKSILFLLLLILQSCSSATSQLYPPEKGNSENRTVYVTSNGWHTGFIFNRKEAEPYLFALRNHFLDSPMIEVGWGDAEFYPAKEVTVAIFLKAAFLPTETVLQVVPVQPGKYFFNETAALELSHSGFKKLIQYIDNSFALNSKNKITQLGKSLYGKGYFYKANGKFHLFQTCNKWTADGIRETGFPISTFYALTADNVMYQISKFSQYYK